MADCNTGLRGRPMCVFLLLPIRKYRLWNQLFQGLLQRFKVACLTCPAAFKNKIRIQVVCVRLMPIQASAVERLASHQAASEAFRLSNCPAVWWLHKATRTRAVPMGTVGGLTADVSKPRSSKNALSCNALVSSPTTMGTMWVVECPVFSPNCAQ